MTSDLQTAKDTLLSGGYTCVLCRENQIFTSFEKGIRPLEDFIDSGRDFTGFSAADTIVGRAAAFLYVLLGVESLYADVISSGAVRILEQNGISVEYRVKTENIRNRSNTGICPMEEAVSGITDAKAALTAIKQTSERLRRKYG